MGRPSLQQLVVIFERMPCSYCLWMQKVQIWWYALIQKYSLRHVMTITHIKKKIDMFTRKTLRSLIILFCFSLSWRIRPLYILFHEICIDQWTYLVYYTMRCWYRNTESIRRNIHSKCSDEFIMNIYCVWCEL